MDEVRRNLYSLGETYLRMGRPESALRVLEESRRTKAAFPWFGVKVLLDLGSTHLQLGQYQQAAVCFQRGVEASRVIEQHAV